MTPHSSVDNLVKLEQQSQGGSAVNLNANGKRGSSPDLGDLGAAVAASLNKDFDEAVRKWERDVRGRFLAHLKEGLDKLRDGLCD